MTETTVRYEYQPIRPDQLRLLKFARDDGSHTIAALSIFSIDSLPPYNSISYTWTSNETSAQQASAVEINGRPLPVLASLQPFIETLRAKGKLVDDTWWWIDSICIDQTNLQERAEQVQLINLVYRQASNVVVWLGVPSDDSELAMDFIRFIDKTYRDQLSREEFCALLQEKKYRPEWGALTNLLSRKWWTRIWTIQEFVLATSVSFWCGMRSVCRVAMCNAIRMADKCPEVGIKDTLAFTLANTRRRALTLYHDGEQKSGIGVCLPLAALAAYFSCMDATDDRDRLYGLMALATDRSIMEADYTEDVQTTYTTFVQSFVRRYASLDIICLAPLYRSPPSIPVDSCPSWVPYWARGPIPTLITPAMVSQSGRNHIGNLRHFTKLNVDPGVCYKASKDRPPEYSFDGGSLHARGVAFDTVDGLAGDADHCLVQSRNGGTSGCGCDLAPSTPRDVLRSICRSLALGREDRYMRSTLPMDDFFKDFMNLLARVATGTGPETPPEWREWYEHTKMLRHRGRSVESLAMEATAEASEVRHLPSNVDVPLVNNFFGRFYDVVVRRSLRLLVTGDGRVGMAPPSAAQGHIICVLYGCSVPVLLRQSSSDFINVGECFIDGCMEGSVLEMAGLSESVFVIH